MRTHARYKIDGKYVYLPKLSEAERVKARKAYMKKWRKDNPDKVRANTKRYLDFKRKEQKG